MFHRRNPFALFGLAIVALLLVLAPAASAKSRDRNHDRIPDKWESTHHLSLKVNQAKKDQDHDGMKNRAEFEAGTDPRDNDTDDDGIEDGSEESGTVVSFTGGTLTIKLFKNDKTVAGTVDDQTELACEGPGSMAAKQASIRDGGDGPGDHNDRDGHEHADENDDQGDDAGSSCATDQLKTGTVVHEAELSTTPGGLHFDEIKLGAAPS